MSVEIPIDDSKEQYSGEKTPVELHLSRYLEELEQLGIADGVIVGHRLDENKGYIWNVLHEEFSLKKPSPHSFIEANQSISRVTHNLRNILPTRISYVNPSRVQELIERCKLRKIDIVFIKFNDPVH